MSAALEERFTRGVLRLRKYIGLRTECWGLSI